MNWARLAREVTGLRGRRLRSISGRSDIRLIRFDAISYVVERSDGKRIKRKTQELRRLAAALSARKPIHVDGFLQGSGSSRSHPETILANLSGVEWVRKQGRKRIQWVGRRTHPSGTLRK